MLRSTLLLPLLFATSFALAARHPTFAQSEGEVQVFRGTPTTEPAHRETASRIVSNRNVRGAHSIALTRGKLYRVHLKSRERTMAARLETEMGRLLLSSDATIPRNTDFYFAAPQTGPARIVVESGSGKAALYELRLTALAPASFLAVEQRLQSAGAFHKTDPFYSYFLQRCHFHVTQLDCRPGEIFVVDMQSAVVDSYLRLEEKEGIPQATDDDSGGAPHARLLVATREPAKLRVVASTAVARETGAYFLTIQRFATLKAAKLRHHLERASLEWIERAQDHDARAANADAMRCYEQNLLFSEQLHPARQFPQGHPAIGRAMTNLAEAAKIDGDLVRARRLFESAHAIYRKLYPLKSFKQPASPLLTSISNLSDANKLLGELGTAGELANELIRLRSLKYPASDFPHGHPKLALGLNNAASIAAEQGRLAVAESYLRRCLAMLRALTQAGVKQREFHEGQVLNNLSTALARQGKYDKALAVQRQAFAHDENFYPRERFPLGHPQLAKAMSSLANRFAQTGQFEEAAQWARRGLEMRKNLYPATRHPRGHRDIALSLYDAAAIHFASGQLDRARNDALKAGQMQNRLNAAVVQSLPESTALNYLAGAAPTRDLLLSLPPSTSEDSAARRHKDIYDQTWRARSLVFRLIERRRRDLLANQDAETAALLRREKQLREQIGSMLLEGAEPGVLAKVNQAKESIEEQIAIRLNAQPIRPRTKATPTDLQAALNPSQAFVDVLRYQRFEAGQPDSTASRDHYVAFVLRTDTVDRVDLGDAAMIESLLARWRRTLHEGRDDARDASALRRQVWEPISAKLSPKTKTIFVAPDAALTRLPWDALPDEAPRLRLVERYAFASVPHGQHLLRQLTEARPTGGAQGMLLVGDVDYGMPPQTAQTESKHAAGHADHREAAVVWEPLPETAHEIQTLQSFSPAPDKDFVLRGQAATSAAVIRHLPQSRFAHLATHGFFADRQLGTTLPIDDAPFEKFRERRLAVGARNPFVLSGLVLAGANGGQAKQGLLTADAIIGLDLRSLDLAVLSACETGLGDVASGEGVYSLQNAFHQAGAGTVVASLWKVDDRATQTLMREFYENLITRKLTKLESLRRAKVAMLRRYEPSKGVLRGLARESVRVTPKRTPKSAGVGAHYWAAFQLSGDAN